jgi:hypothetical protein
MALTLEAEQRWTRLDWLGCLRNIKLCGLRRAKQTKEFVTGNFPAGAKIRRDDVAKALIPILEVNETLKDKLNEQKLRGKFWIRDFVDLIIDRTWEELEKGKGHGKEKDTHRR